MNKKGAIPVIAWVVIALIGIILANEAGLFSITQPPETLGKPIELINPYYYDDAVNNYIYPCEEANVINFRTDDLTYYDSSSGSDAIAFKKAGTLSEGDILIGYGRYAFGISFAGTISNPKTCEDAAISYGWNGGFIQNVPGDLRRITTGHDSIKSCDDLFPSQAKLYDAGDGNTLIICAECVSGGDAHFYTFKQSDSDADDGPPEYYGLQSYFPEGETTATIYLKGTPKFTCRDINGDLVNDVVLQYCQESGLGYTIQQTCESGQACKYYTAAETINLFAKPAVKCGIGAQWYTQNKQLCEIPTGGSFYYQTNTDGTNLNPVNCPTASGGVCFQDTKIYSEGKLTSATAHCTECGSSKTRCLTATEVQTCSGSGFWTTSQTCTGDATCQFDSTLNKYTCKSGFSDGQLRCDPNNDKQRQRYNGVTFTWENNGAVCRTKCNINEPSKCTNDCIWENYDHCSNGIISFCDKNADIGNIVDMVINPPRTCAYPINEPPQCKDTTTCAAPYEIGKTYCISSHLRVGVLDTSDTLVTRGVKLNDLYGCVYGCTESTPPGTATCNPSTILPASKCLRSNQKVCSGLNSIVQCNQYKDAVSPAGSCLTINHQYCDDSDTTIDAYCAALPTDCTGSMKCVDGTTIQECNSGYLTGTTLENCNGNGCTEDIAGQPECNPATICSGQPFDGNFYSCEGTFSWPCNKVVSQDWDGYKLIKGTSSLDCSPNTCQITANENDRCTSQCTSGQNTCGGVGGNDVYTCENGVPTTKIKSCVPASGSVPGGCLNGACINQCTTISTTCTASGSDEISNNCWLDTVTNQKVLNQTLCEFGCTGGACNSQCIGNIACYNNRIYNCIGGAIKINELVDNCDGGGDLPSSIGCSVITLTGGQLVKCNDQCSAFGPLECTTTTPSDSIICAKSPTNQLYKKTIECGQLGCSSTTKECQGSIYKNSFDCDPNGRKDGGLLRDLWSTNDLGQFIEFKYTCVSPSPIPVSSTGLSAYCKPNVGQCTYCEKNLYYCVNDGKTQLQCSNELTGEAVVGSIQSCEAGCEVTPYCDQLVMSLGTTNFGTNPNSEFGDVYLVVSLKGSMSQKIIGDVDVEGVLSGAGIADKTATAKTDTTYGRATLTFTQIPKGAYNITVSAEGYSTKIINRKITVTDLFVVSKYGSTDIVYLIPGYNPYFTIQCVSPNSAEPDSLVALAESLTLGSPKKSTVNTKLWEIPIVGSPQPGQYEIGFKPSKTGVSLLDIEEQILTFQIEKPSLVITTNLPDSITPGEKDFKIQVSGPRYDAGVLTTGGIKPDVQPTAKVTFNGVESNMLLLDNGGGEYLVTYTFENVGTYTINIDAVKAGYNQARLSKPVQASNSGTDAPPSTTGSGDAQPGIIEQVTSGYTPWIIGAIVLVGIYLIFTRRRR